MLLCMVTAQAYTVDEKAQSRWDAAWMQHMNPPTRDTGEEVKRKGGKKKGLQKVTMISPQTDP